VSATAVDTGIAGVRIAAGVRAAAIGITTVDAPAVAAIATGERDHTTIAATARIVAPGVAATRVIASGVVTARVVASGIITTGFITDDRLAATGRIVAIVGDEATTLVFTYYGSIGKNMDEEIFDTKHRESLH
jgi:hypothetical protein